MLADKKRLPVGEIHIFSLNVNGMLKKFSDLLLAALRPPYLIEQFLIQESYSHGVHWPGYDLHESKPMLSNGRGYPLHGMSTYTCNIKSHDMVIVSQQCKESWLNETNLSAVITNWEKFSKDSKSPEQIMASLNIYIPNRASGSKLRENLNRKIIEYIFDTVLPTTVKNFPQLIISSDTNADLQNLDDAKNNTNESKLKEFINKNPELKQHNKEFRNRTYFDSDRIIDGIFTSNAECSVKYGGHIGNENYHPALLSNIKYETSKNKNMNCDFKNSSNINDKGMTWERNWKDLSNMHSLSKMNGRTALENMSFMGIWQDNLMIRYEPKNNYFDAKCKICGWTIIKARNVNTSRTSFANHFKKHMQRFSEMCIQDLLCLFEKLDFKLLD